MELYKSKYYYYNQEEQLAKSNLRYEYNKIFEKDKILNNNRKYYYKEIQCPKCSKELYRGIYYNHIAKNCNVRNKILSRSKHETTIYI